MDENSVVIDEFVLRHIFHRIPESPQVSEVFWREVKGGEEGYILVWRDGERHHTYHHPENTFGPSDPSWE